MPILTDIHPYESQEDRTKKAQKDQSELDSQEEEMGMRAAWLNYQLRQ